jgi:hypothetical protein
MFTWYGCTRRHSLIANPRAALRLGDTLQLFGCLGGEQRRNHLVYVDVRYLFSPAAGIRMGIRQGRRARFAATPLYIYIYVHALSFMHPHRPHCLDIQGWLKCCVPVYFCNTWTRLVTSDECTSGILPDMSRQHLIVTKSISPVNCWGQTLAVAISLPDQTGNIQTRSIRPPET